MKQKVALVLSGGGARGLAHIGVIKELEKRNFQITSLAGTSMGSVVAGVYAHNQLADFEHWIRNMNPRDMLSQIDFAFGEPGLLKADKVLNSMKAFITDMNIEDLALPYCAVAVDLLKRQEVVFKSGSMYEAMRASIAIPSVITPVTMGDKVLVDGGIMNNVPVGHIQRTPGDIVIAVNVNARVALNENWLPQQKKEDKSSETLAELQQQLKKYIPRKKKKAHKSLGYFDIVGNTISLMTNHIAQLQLELNPPDIMINVSRNTAETFDFHKASQLIDYGQACAKEELNKLINN